MKVLRVHKLKVVAFLLGLATIQILYLYSKNTLDLRSSDEVMRFVKTKTPIIVQANYAFLELLLNLLCSAEAVGIPKSRFLIWAMDNQTHSAMIQQSVASYYDPLTYYGTPKATAYHSKEYNRMMRQRSRFWLQLLERGVSFWWIDADVSLAKNIDHLIHRNEADLLIQLDGPYYVQPSEIIKEKLSLKHIPGKKWVEACAGFFFVRSNSRTVRFFRELDRELARNPILEDQQVMNSSLEDPNVSKLVLPGTVVRKEPKQLQYQFFPQEKVTSGHVFCMYPPFGHWPTDVKRSPTAFHMNCVVHAKKHSTFEQLQLWYLDKDGTCKHKIHE